MRIVSTLNGAMRNVYDIYLRIYAAGQAPARDLAINRFLPLRECRLNGGFAFWRRSRFLRIGCVIEIAFKSAKFGLMSP